MVLIARKGVIVLHEAYGNLTPETDSPPLELDTIFPLASITKPITATAAMILVEDGLLGLNRGIYGETRILSPASVAEMTRNQIPGISSWLLDEFFPEAFWGLGWSIKGNKKFLGGGALDSSEAFSHIGAGGVFLWSDPVYEIVGVYFSVVLEQICIDLFMNAVTADVVEE